MRVETEREIWESSGLLRTAEAFRGVTNSCLPLYQITLISSRAGSLLARVSPAHRPTAPTCIQAFSPDVLMDCILESNNSELYCWNNITCLSRGEYMRSRCSVKA